MSEADSGETNTCKYECIHGLYVLVGGSTPDGFECPVDLGVCDVSGDIILGPPVPIEEPVPDDPPESLSRSSTESSTIGSNSASYVYHFSTGKLYFSSGKADKGNGFFSSLTLDQLASYYPSIAEDMSVLLAVRSLASFKLTLPALPASVIARGEE